MKGALPLSKLSAIVAGVSLASIVIVGFSLTHPDQVTGPLTKLLGHFIGSEPAVGSFPTMRGSGIFDIHEPNLRFLLTVYGVITALISGVLASLAAQEENTSLWYSLALFCSATALSELSYLAGILFFVVFGVTVIYLRQGKMTLK